MSTGNDGTGGRQVFDAHLHVVDPRFPLVPNDGYLPPEFTVSDYTRRVAGLGVIGGAVVSGSFQAFDQTYLLDALGALGDGFVGVTQLPASVTDEEVLHLDACGVRALRFNVRRGGSESLSHLDTLARRVHELAGWHAELYIDSRDLDDLGDLVAALPAASIDHLGLSAEGLPHLLTLVEKGVRVKATGLGRGNLDVAAALTALVAVNPRAVMFGTDLPSTRAPRPFADSDLEIVADAVGSEHVEAVFYGNAAEFYRVAEPLAAARTSC